MNNAPVLLQSFEGLEIVEDSGAAAMVLYAITGDVFHLIYYDDLYLHNYFTLTVNAVNDAPVLLQPLKDLEIVEDSGAAAVVFYTILGGLVYPISNLL